MSMLLPQVLSQKKHLKFHLKIILKRSLQLTTLWHYLINNLMLVFNFFKCVSKKNYV